MLPNRHKSLVCLFQCPSISFNLFSQNLAHSFNESVNPFTLSQSALIWEALPTVSEPVHMLFEIGVNNAKTY